MCKQTCQVSRNFRESPEKAGDLQVSRKCKKMCHYPPPPNRVRLRKVRKFRKSRGWHRPGGPHPKHKSWLRRCSRPLLPPSLPPSILPPSFPAPRCPPASCRATQYTSCVYTVLVSCTGYCVGRAQPGGVTQPGVALRQWSGRAISKWLAVTLATHPHDESVFDE